MIMESNPTNRFNVPAFRKRATTFVVTGLGAGVAALASFSLALYDAATPKKLHVAAIGEAIDTGRWNVTLLDARFGRKPGASATRPEQLAIEMEITNRSAETSNSFGRLLKLDNVPPGLIPVFYLARDDAILYGLHPDMPERVIVRWDWPSGVEPPKQIELSIASQIHKKRDNLYGAPGWFDRSPLAKAMLSVNREAPL
jgi:hypothetical protein